MTSEDRRRQAGFSGDQPGWPPAFFERVEPAEAETGPGAVESSATDMEAVIEGEAVEYAGVYIISVAARLLEMHPQTLRKYERFGLIRPSRTAGALRLYSDQDLARLRIVRRLVEELGLNLAGVRLLMEVVLQLGIAIRALEQDEATRDTPGARTAMTHLRALLDYLSA